MDAKSKAQFINSVAGGQGIPCPSCNTLNEPDSLFCVSCGTKLITDDFQTASQTEKRQEQQVFKKIVPEEEKKEVTEKEISEKQPFQVFVEAVDDDLKEVSVFAQGLPAWDIVPPQVVVRRKTK